MLGVIVPLICMYILAFDSLSSSVLVFADQAFWPSLVMKKWLNIKPKVYDFSEDEVDTETESEDDDASYKGYKIGHRRGKSETLRVQYINTKEVRSGGNQVLYD
ncbi:unnamed protein product [Sphenostylis stenocarpa]|uniref:Uncharacterized protein n=1 Tax=Sphenostylis stenocarpa TaxID=92480 RepID=A0AA86SD51_9FABA|nr:unnamed protein product [Sphenostylis stenocarpa]